MIQFVDEEVHFANFVYQTYNYQKYILLKCVKTGDLSLVWGMFWQVIGELSMVFDAVT